MSPNPKWIEAPFEISGICESKHLSKMIKQFRKLHGPLFVTKQEAGQGMVKFHFKAKEVSCPRIKNPQGLRGEWTVL